MASEPKWNTLRPRSPTALPPTSPGAHAFSFLWSIADPLRGSAEASAARARALRPSTACRPRVDRGPQRCYDWTRREMFISALTIAGSDSGGGAGIQADLQDFLPPLASSAPPLSRPSRPRTHLRVERAGCPDPTLVAAQIQAVATDLHPHAAKTGMLANAALIDTVVACVTEFNLHPLVVDPVMVASSGDVLLHPDAVAALRSRLLPLADLITPNLAEAEVLTGRPVKNEAEMRAAAIALVEMGASAALVKGGHLSGMRWSISSLMAASFTRSARAASGG